MTLKHSAFAAAIALSLPVASLAASVTTSNFSGNHFHSGGNTGDDYLATTNTDRTDAIPMSPGGLVIGTTTNAYAGSIANVAGIREGRTRTTSATVGLMEDDGFYFNSVVTTEAECTRKEGVASGCLPFMGNQASLTFEFSVDINSILYFNGQWSGGNGTESIISVVDFLSLRVRQDNGFGGFLTPYRVDTNGPNRNEPSGLFTGSIALTAGETYIFDFSHRAAAQSPDAVGVPDTDTSFLNFAASIVEANADVDAFADRFAAAAAPVPLPAAGWMLLAGVGAMGALRRRKHR